MRPIEPAHKGPRAWIPVGGALRILALGAALSFGGCAQFLNWAQNDVIDPTAAFFSNPNTIVVGNEIKVAAEQVAQATQALACVIAAGTSVAGQIEANPAFKVAASTQGTNLKINVASQATCQNLSGVLSGNVVVPAGGTVLQ